MSAQTNSMMELLNPDQLLLVEQLADRILWDIGIEFRGDPETLALLDGFGARIEGERVRLSGPDLRDLIRENAPHSFRLKARNPERDLTVGQGDRLFVPSYGTPNIRHLDGGYGLATMQDYEMLVRLAQDMPAINHTGSLLCFPHDVSERHRAIEIARAHLTHSDKPFMGTVFTPEGCTDVLELMMHFLGEQEFESACYLLHLINSNPPLVYVAKALKALRQVAARNQGCIITSYMMMGASSPVSLLESLAQGYAEVMAGIGLTQLVRPGAPVMGGIYGIPFSMQSMIPFYGDPLALHFQWAGAQLFRRLGIPTRGDGALTSSNSLDDQAKMESSHNLQAALASGADMILHAAGWLENGRTVSVAKFESDCDWLEHFIPDSQKSQSIFQPLNEKQKTELGAIVRELRGRRS